jgi:hypothetical protein
MFGTVMETWTVMAETTWATKTGTPTDRVKGGAFTENRKQKTKRTSIPEVR